MHYFNASWKKKKGFFWLHTFNSFENEVLLWIFEFPEFEIKSLTYFLDCISWFQEELSFIN